MQVTGEEGVGIVMVNNECVWLARKAAMSVASVTPSARRDGSTVGNHQQRRAPIMNNNRKSIKKRAITARAL